jgi:hypothetical protein
MEGSSASPSSSGRETVRGELNCGTSPRGPTWTQATGSFAGIGQNTGRRTGSDAFVNMRLALLRRHLGAQCMRQMHGNTPAVVEGATRTEQHFEIAPAPGGGRLETKIDIQSKPLLIP